MILTKNGLSIRQAIVDDPELSPEPKLTLIVEKKIPGELIPEFLTEHLAETCGLVPVHGLDRVLRMPMEAAGIRGEQRHPLLLSDRVLSQVEGLGEGDGNGVGVGAGLAVSGDLQAMTNVIANITNASDNCLITPYNSLAVLQD
jgi:hypothetical protein